jgi:predicted DNA binding CopG/RHH family protein
MSPDRWDSLLDRDWSADWDTLPAAPELVPRSKTAQITLRVPSSLLARIKSVAAARSLPHHALARSWIVDGLREAAPSAAGATLDEPQTEQVNIKLDQGVLDALKARSHELRRPYHRLAREWIEAALDREEKSLGIQSARAGLPAMKDLMALLLHAPNQRGSDAIRGITQLQKLVFVIEQKVAAQRSSFYAYNYGPFNEEVSDAANALRLAGFLRGAQPATAGPPSFAEMMATAVKRSGPSVEPTVEEFELNERGHQAAERLRRSSGAYDRLYAYVSALRHEWDTPDLVERVYDAYPKYAERSLIRDQVAQRRSRRRSS